MQSMYFDYYAIIVTTTKLITSIINRKESYKFLKK
jgi:hypothetical protein